jgi:hypothetical protein
VPKRRFDSCFEHRSEGFPQSEAGSGLPLPGVGALWSSTQVAAVVIDLLDGPPVIGAAAAVTPSG